MEYVLIIIFVILIIYFIFLKYGDIVTFKSDLDDKYYVIRRGNKDEKYIASKFVKKGETIFNEFFKRGGQRIFEETKGLIDDWHFGESGHKILSEIFYSHINNKLI